jgi:hypothetical protein
MLGRVLEFSLSSKTRPIFFSALSAALVGHFVFPLGSLNCDSGTYEWMAGLFASHRINFSGTPERLAGIWPWLTSIDKTDIIPKYQPGFPFVLSVMPVVLRIALFSLIAALSTWSIGNLAKKLDLRAVWASWLWALSPLVIIQSALVLPYLLSCTLGILSLSAMCQADSRVQYPAAVSGTFLGMMLLMRPLDSAIFLIPIIVLITRKTASRKRVFAVFAVGASPAVVVAIWWNWHQTGNFLEFPFQLTSHSDTVGFGLRKIYDFEPGLHFTPVQAANNVASNLFRVVTWSCLGILLLGGFTDRWRALTSDARVILLSLGVVWTVAYGCFYGSYVASNTWKGASYIGPFYWLPILLILVLVHSQEVPQNVHRASERRFLGLGLVWSLTVLTVTLHRNYLLTQSWQSSEVYRVARDLHSLVVLDSNYTPWVGVPLPFMTNSPNENPHYVRNFEVALSMVRSSTRVYLALDKQNQSNQGFPALVRLRVSNSLPKVHLVRPVPSVVVRRTRDNCRWWIASKPSKGQFVNFNTVPKDSHVCNGNLETGELSWSQTSLISGQLLQKVFVARKSASSLWVANYAPKIGTTPSVQRYLSD